MLKPPKHMMLRFDRPQEPAVAFIDTHKVKNSLQLF